MNMNTTKVEQDVINRMRDQRARGMSYAQVGSIFGVSRQRVHQLLSGYGKSRGTVRYEKLRTLVFIRDDFKCQKCGEGDKIVMHHIDGDNDNNEIDNQLTLCKSCHSRIHACIPRTMSPPRTCPDLPEVRTCNRPKCGHRWLPRKEGRPAKCPRCQNRKWDR